MPRKKLESYLEDYCVDYSQRIYGVLGIKMNLWGHVGYPDRLYLFHNGTVLWHEYKRQGKKTTKIQAHRAKQLREWGFTVEAIDTRDLGRASIDAFARGKGCTPPLEAT